MSRPERGSGSAVKPVICLAWALTMGLAAAGRPLAAPVEVDPAFGYRIGDSGNPVVLYFLEREVRELKRLTGGSVSFYRNRIRKALAGEAMVRETQVSYDGRSVKATEIRIDPYVDDPARSRFEKFAERYYVMVLSPEIPGEVYRMKAELKGSAGTPEAGRILHSETLVFDRQDGGQARRGQ